VKRNYSPRLIRHIVGIFNAQLTSNSYSPPTPAIIDCRRATN